MYKKISYLFISSALAICLLSGCSSIILDDQIIESSNTDEVSNDNTMIEPTIENTDNEEESSNNEDSTNTDESVNIEDSTNVDEIANAEDSTNASEIVNNEDSTNVSNSESQKETLFEKYVFYREDFEIPDIYNTGYTNMIDFYNDYPNGKVAGTEGNLCLGVYYKYDVDLSFEESLAFKTYRGIGLGSSLDEVFDAYGTVAFEPPHDGCIGLSDEEHTLKYFVCYWAEIESGAYMDIRFYFDQNDTVMSIDYSAVYEKYASKINADTFEIVND